MEGIQKKRLNGEGCEKEKYVKRKGKSEEIM